MSFAQGNALRRIVSSMGPVPLLALNTGSYGQNETATPRGIATGQNDAFLFQLNAVVDSWPGDRFYVRPFPEMNAHWEATCAYNANGTLRDAAHSTLWNRKALARIAVIVRGGTQADDQRTAREARAARRRARPARDDAEAAHRLEPAGLRRAEPPRQLRAGVLPGRRVCRRDRQRPLRHPRARRDVGRGGGAVQGASDEAVRVPRVGRLGLRRPGVRPRDGDLRASSTAASSSSPTTRAGPGPSSTSRRSLRRARRIAR